MSNVALPSDAKEITLSFRCGDKTFSTAEELKQRLNAAAEAGVQHAKLRLINYIRSPGPNRGYLFPKDTGALINDGVGITTEYTAGGLNFKYTYGFLIGYAKYVNLMDFITKLGLYHFQFFQNKLPTVVRILEEELKASFSAFGLAVRIDFSNLAKEAETLIG